MARISTYNIDENVTSLDKWIGTRADGSVTKNFSAQGIADFLNNTSAVTIAGQNNFFFQTSLANGRAQGTISFTNGGGSNTAFASLTTIKISRYANSGYIVLDYLQTLVDQAVFVAQTDNVNNFGIYKLLTLVQDVTEPEFYNATFQLIRAHGSLLQNKFYAFSVYPGFISYPFASPTPTLQQVTNIGNTTTNSIKSENTNYFSIIEPSDVGTENKTTNSYTYIGADGVIGIKTSGFEGNIKSTNLIDNISLEFPNKIAGTYTIATTEDIGSGYVPYIGATQDVLLGDYGIYMSSQFAIYLTPLNGLVIGDSVFSSQIIPSGISFEDPTSNSSSSFRADGLYLNRRTSLTEGALKASNITNNITLQFPNKAAGTYTIATTSDLPSITPAALTKTDDTNVTLTLGGTPATSLLQAVSLTLGWTGTLADSRIASASNWNAKQNAITLGTTAQYFRGDLSLATFPTNVSSFTNDSGYITSSALSPYLTSATAVLTYFPIPIGTTSQYIRGDGSLATFTTYALPIATASVLGGVKIGTGVSVALDGTISVSTNYQSPLSGTGFVKSTAGVISYDTNTYYLASNPSGFITGITSSDVTTALGYTPVTNARTLTINGVGYNLTADRSWTIPTFTSPLTTKGDLFTFNSTNARLPVGLDTQVLIADSTQTTGLKWGSNTAATPTGYYGAFQDVTNQTAAVINTGYPMLLGVTDLSNGVTVVSNSRITIANTGIYNIQWSAQFTNPLSAEHDVTIWLRKNGVDVPGSSGVVLVPAKHGSSDGHTLPSWNFLLDVVAGDYYEFVWSTANTSVYISFQPAGNPPPSTASVVLTVTQQSGIMAGTGITAINSLTGAVQTLTTGTTGTDFSIVDSGTDHKFNLPTASASNRGALSSADWTTFNGKQSALSGTGLVKSTTGTISYITDNSTNWDSAYTNRITSLTTTGTGVATLIANVLNIPTPPSATFTSLTTTGSSGASTLLSGVLNIPTYTLSGLGGITLSSLSSTATGLTYTNTTGVFSLTSGYLIPTTAGYNNTNWDTAYVDRNKWDGGATGLVAATGRTSLGLGTFAVKDYPTWTTGTPFVKMTAAGTFALDTNTYLTSVGTGVANELTYWSGVNTLGSLTTATYPSLIELSYVKGVTSSIQTQIGGKQATITGAATTITSSDLTVSRALTSNASGKVAVSTVTDTELGYVSGVTSSIQTQLNTKQASLSYTPYKFISTTQSTVTGTVAETITATATIAGGSFAATDIMKLLFQVTKAITISNVTLRIKINTSNTISGATNIGTFTFPLANVYSMFQRNYSLNGGNLLGYSFNVSLLSDINTNATAALSSTTYNAANTLYLFFTIQLGNSADSVTFQMANITN